MSSRTFHHKSRHGCLTCKQRRKKCDLQVPTCQTCQRLQLKCIYQDILHPGSYSKNNQARLAASLTYYPHSLYQAISDRSSHFEALDFELAYHYLQLNSDKFTTIPGLTALQGLDYTVFTPHFPYLLHGVLSSSALYLASSQVNDRSAVSERYEQKAIYHHQLALVSYTRSLSAIDARSCQFVFGFSVILAGLQLAFCSALPFKGDEDLQARSIIDNVTGVFHLMLGAVTVAEEASQWIPIDRPDPILLPIRSMLHHSPVKIEGEVDSAFDRLISQIESAQSQHDQRFSISQDDATVCLSAALKLRGVFGYINASDPVRYKVAVGWLAFVGRPFVDLIRARQPTALVVLSYFGVAMHSVRPVWWLKSIGAKLTLAVDHTLHELGAQDWYTLSRWAVSRILRADQSQTVMDWPQQSSSTNSNQNLQSHNSFEMAYGFVCSFDYTKEHDIDSAS